jgi:HK97 gp10 family phage protein
VTVSIKLEGLKEIAAALDDLPKATGKNILRRVLLARAEPIAKAAIGNVPVLTGALRSSINVSTRLTRRQRKKHRKAKPDDVEVFVGPGTDPAAHLQEFGTSKEPAQPFMRPAWDAEKNGVMDGIKDDLWGEIEKAVARRAKKLAKGR